MKNEFIFKAPCNIGDRFWAFNNGDCVYAEPIDYIIEGIEFREDGIYFRTSYDMTYKYDKETAFTKNEAIKKRNLLIKEIENE